MTCEQVQQDLTLALLGKLELDEQTRQHLERCPACAAERASLLPVSELLGALDLADLSDPDPVFEADRITASLLERAASVRRAHRRRMASLFALAAGVLVVAGVGLTSLFDSGPTSLIATATANGIRASASFHANDVGSAVDLSVSGVARGTTCRMFVVAHDGSRQTLITWVADYGGGATMHAQTRFAIADVASISIKRVGGPVLLEVPVQA